MFKLPPKNHIPDTEINQILKLKFAHHEKVSAITQYLWEDYLKNSDVGEAAKIEAKREEEELFRLLAENEETNRQVAKRREDRLAQEAEEAKVRIAGELQQHADEERRRLELADKLVREETEDLKNVIKNDQALEEAIWKALDNPIDYEYSIDLEGHIYPGRLTKATKVPADERQKIATPVREGARILGIVDNEKEVESSN